LEPSCPQAKNWQGLTKQNEQGESSKPAKGDQSHQRLNWGEAWFSITGNPLLVTATGGTENSKGKINAKKTVRHRGFVGNPAKGLLKKTHL